MMLIRKTFGHKKVIKNSLLFVSFNLKYELLKNVKMVPFRTSNSDPEPVKGIKFFPGGKKAETLIRMIKESKLSVSCISCPFMPQFKYLDFKVAAFKSQPNKQHLCMCLQYLARRSFWQDRVRASCKIIQVLARPIKCKIEQEDLASICKIN